MFSSKDLDTLSSGQKIEFLAQLLEEGPLPIEKLDKMEQLYNLNANNNSEIKCKWIRLGLKGKWMNAVPRAVEMVTEQGRMKFLRPIYRYRLLVSFNNHLDTILPILTTHLSTCVLMALL